MVSSSDAGKNGIMMLTKLLNEIYKGREICRQTKMRYLQDINEEMKNKDNMHSI